jgi:putative CocE/NonD family hydrolase
MSESTSATSPPVSSMSVLERAGSGDPLPPPEPMPLPEHRVRLAMRDGVRLDTNVWLPEAARAGGRVPAILLRTPYKESVMGFRRLGVLRYVEAGYAVVIQQIRGVGESEGHFSFNAPHERGDGYDTVEWIAAQAWCDGGVGMDGSSYVGMTQIAAAAACPPHLRCIVPAVPCVDFFREVPYNGGIFARQHTINWMRIVQIDSLNDLSAGFVGTMPILSQPAVLQRMTMRPLFDAADGELTGDYLAHYHDALAHPTFDDWWCERAISAEEFARIGIPTLVVSGNFDMCIGALTLWRGLEANAPGADERRLLIGPWDHGQSYSGGAASHGPYTMGEASVLDLIALRLAFFDQHLKRRGCGPELGSTPSGSARVRLFVTGVNAWRSYDAFPPREVTPLAWHLASEGRANSARGDGRLLREAPAGTQPADSFVDDPALPFVPALAAATEPMGQFDLREHERQHEVLVYDSGVLAKPLTILGEAEAELFVAVDAPDADLVLRLAEHRADGATVRLAGGQLRLRYLEGYDAERLLTPNEPVKVRIPLTYVAHCVPAGSRLRLLVSGSNFPLADPNPHTGEPVASAVAMRSALQTVFHDAARPSKLVLPVLP